MDVNLIQRGDLQERLAKVLRIYGETSPAPTLAPEVQAVVILEELTSQSLAINPISKRYTGSVDLAAGGAGFLANAKLDNPAASGVIIRVDSVRVGSILAQTVQIGRTDQAIAVVGALPEISHDTRGPGAAGTYTAQAINAVNCVQFAFSIEQIAANTSRDCYPTFDRNGVILVPGEGFGINGLTANQQLRVSVTWTEFTAA